MIELRTPQIRWHTWPFYVGAQASIGFAMAPCPGCNGELESKLVISFDSGEHYYCSPCAETVLRDSMTA